jgi:hypothetical protein
MDPLEYSARLRLRSARLRRDSYTCLLQAEAALAAGRSALSWFPAPNV